MNEISRVSEKRFINGDRLSTTKVFIDGTVTNEEIEALKAAHGEVFEHSIVLYQPPVNVEEAVQEAIAEKEAVISTIIDYLPDEIAITHTDLFPTMKFDGSTILAGTRLNIGGKLYKTNVDLWDNAESTPDTAPTLWSEIVMQDEYRTIPETITAELAFAKDEIGYWPADGKHYKALADGTVWTPAAYPAAWVEVIT